MFTIREVMVRIGVVICIEARMMLMNLPFMFFACPFIYFKYVNILVAPYNSFLSFMVIRMGTITRKNVL